MTTTAGEGSDSASATDAPTVDAPAKPPPRSWIRRWLPFILAIALLAWVAHRIDFQAFGHALAQLDYVGFTTFTIVWALCLLGADALGGYVAYRITMPGVRWIDLAIYRGASYIPSVANFHVGQAYLTYLMSKLGKVSIARMAGATVISYVSWLGCLVGCVSIALLFADLPWFYEAAAAGMLALGVLYLVVIQLRPRFMAQITFFSPLFEAGLKGHLLALVARIPHLLVLVLGTWGSYFFFGVHIPIGQTLIYMPIVLMGATLPLTPQGFGTRDTLSGLFFEQYAPDPSHSERLGRLVACTTSWGVITLLVAVLIGLVCSRIVRKRLRALGEA